MTDKDVENFLRATLEKRLLGRPVNSLPVAEVERIVGDALAYIEPFRVIGPWDVEIDGAVIRVTKRSVKEERRRGPPPPRKRARNEP